MRYYDKPEVSLKECYDCDFVTTTTWEFVVDPSFGDMVK